MYKQAVSSIPKELDECAYMDGCKRISVLFQDYFSVIKTDYRNSRCIIFHPVLE